MIGLVSYNIIAVYLGIGQGGIDTSSFNQVSILVMTIINIVGYLLIILLHIFTHPRLVWRIFVDAFSYWYYQGAYSQTMVAHAFCNVDDVSWGTKGSTGQHGGKAYETDKVFFVSAWLFYNALLAYVCIYVDIVVAQPSTGPNNNRRYVLIAIAFYGTIQMFIRLTLAIGHHMWWLLTRVSDCCRGTLEKDRLEKVNALWDKLNRDYQKIEELAIDRMSHSKIIKKSKPN